MASLDSHIPHLASTLIDTEVPLHVRFRSLFTLRGIGGDASIQAIAAVFKDPSALLKHECAYVLGQMQDKAALPVLEAVLRDLKQDVMVRHEASEAMGAIGCSSSLVILEEFINDSAVEVSETCQIAVDRIKWVLSMRDGATPSTKDAMFLSVDPAPPSTADIDVPSLRLRLLDCSLSLFERYRALFALRNANTTESVLAIVDGLSDTSALFRHEIAYVLGQLQSPASVPGLRQNLEDHHESPMVRHECAEALGSIASDDVVPILKRFAEDPELVVKESCVVALDMYNHEKSGDFQYANAI